MSQVEYSGLLRKIKITSESYPPAIKHGVFFILHFLYIYIHIYIYTHIFWSIYNIYIYLQYIYIVLHFLDSVWCTNSSWPGTEPTDPTFRHVTTKGIPDIAAAAQKRYCDRAGSEYFCDRDGLAEMVEIGSSAPWKIHENPLDWYGGFNRKIMEHHLFLWSIFHYIWLPEGTNRLHKNAGVWKTKKLTPMTSAPKMVWCSRFSRSLPELAAQDDCDVICIHTAYTYIYI